MSAAGFATFETTLGTCAVAWSGAGLTGVWLPEPDLLERIAQREPLAGEAAPPPGVQDAIGRIRDLLAGGRPELGDIPLDLQDVPEFSRNVYDIARSIPPGRTLSYGDIAGQLGDRRLARDVGQALGRNPCPIVVPCHRVLAADGSLHGFSAFGGLKTKRRMLEIEGARLPAEQPALF